MFSFFYRKAKRCSGFDYLNSNEVMYGDALNESCFSKGKREAEKIIWQLWWQGEDDLPPPLGKSMLGQLFEI